MTAKELAEKILRALDIYPPDGVATMEPLLSSALEKERIDTTVRLGHETLSIVKEAKAAAYEECAKICDEDQNCDCQAVGILANKIRQLKDSLHETPKV